MDWAGLQSASYVWLLLLLLLLLLLSPAVLSAVQSSGS
jgi:hypothetical protein